MEINTPTVACHDAEKALLWNAAGRRDNPNDLPQRGPLFAKTRIDSVRKIRAFSMPNPIQSDDRRP
jgi:hypothetical protein